MSNTSTRTLWVKNLSNPSETLAISLFSPLGGALRKVINTKDPTRQGVLVEFASDELATKALTALQEKEVDGVRLIVQYAPANLTGISASSVGKTSNLRGSVLDRIIKTSNTSHPKFDDKPLSIENPSSGKEVKPETDSPIKEITDHKKGEISLQNKKADKKEEVHELKAPQTAQPRKIIITKAQQNSETNPLKRLILTPKKKLSKRQEKKNKKKGVKLIIKHHPDAILNLQTLNTASAEVSRNVESNQAPIQQTNNTDTTEPLNTSTAHNIPQNKDSSLYTSKMQEENVSLKNHNNTNSKSRRSASGRNMRSRSRERSRSGSYYRGHRSYRDYSHSNHRDRQYYDDSRYREPHSHSRRRSRSNSSQRRYDNRNRDLYRNKDDYRRRNSRDCSPRRRSCSRSLSRRSPCGSRCYHSRSRSRSFVRSRDRSWSRDSRDSRERRELVIRKREGSTKRKDGYRGEKSVSRERSRERIRRMSPRDRYHSRSRSGSQSRRRMERDHWRRDSRSSELRKDANSHSKVPKKEKRFVKKRRGGKKRQNKKFNQKAKQDGARGSKSSTVVNMPEITTNTSQLSINYLIFPNLQNFYAKGAHQNEEDSSDANLPSYLVPQPKLDTLGGCEAETPGSFHKNVNADFQPNLEDNKCVYQKMEEHSNGFEISTIESKSNVADHEKAFDRPQRHSCSPEPLENATSKTEGDGEESKANYLLTNELVCKNNLRSFINYLVATGDVQGLKEKLKLLEKSK